MEGIRIRHLSSWRYHSGFTLIELLVVMTIIGVLAGIAVPQYRYYRQKSFDSRASTDLRNVATAEEAYFLEAQEYLPCSNSGCTALPGIVSLSNGVELDVTIDEDTFEVRASHPQGTGKEFVWDNTQGGLVNP